MRSVASGGVVFPVGIHELVVAPPRFGDALKAVMLADLEAALDLPFGPSPGERAVLAKAN
jgi:hypothetical protein